MAESAASPSAANGTVTKLTGRAFYESIGSPKYIVAPMVDRSEFAWRLLTRSYLDQGRSKSLLAYSPMIHARLFSEKAKSRDHYFQPTRESLVGKEKSKAQPWLDGNPELDRPLFVQFCANDPDAFLEAAQYVAPYCDAVDLNLGCPQGIAKAGHYGAFLQEDWDLIYKLINRLHNELSVPVTAKIRIQETREKTLEYAKMVLSAGASVLTVHGRRREQKGHNMGVADWDMIRYLRDNLPAETVIFANGNILNSGDIQSCLDCTGADGVMSAEGNLSDPTIFAQPPSETENRDYWRDPSDLTQQGYRIDGVFRRYIDIVYKHVLDQTPPSRPPLFLPGDALPQPYTKDRHSEPSTNGEPPKKKRRKEIMATRTEPNLKAMQGHLFQLLKPMISSHTNIRDSLGRTRSGDMEGFENVLSMVEIAIAEGLVDHEKKQQKQEDTVAREQSQHQQQQEEAQQIKPNDEGGPEAPAPSASTLAEEVKAESEDFASLNQTIAKYKRPWWICQPYIRPLPHEALKLGSMKLSKKELEKQRLAGDTEWEKVDGVVTVYENVKTGARVADGVESKLVNNGAKEKFGGDSIQKPELVAG